MEGHGVGAGKDDETKGLGRLGGNPGTWNGDKEPRGAYRPDIKGPDRDTAGESLTNGKSLAFLRTLGRFGGGLSDVNSGEEIASSI